MKTPPVRGEEAGTAAAGATPAPAPAVRFGVCLAIAGVTVAYRTTRPRVPGPTSETVADDSQPAMARQTPTLGRLLARRTPLRLAAAHDRGVHVLQHRLGGDDHALHVLAAGHLV